MTADGARQPFVAAHEARPPITIDLDRLVSDAPGYEPLPRRVSIDGHTFVTPPRTRYARYGMRDGSVYVEYQCPDGSWCAADKEAE